MNLAKAFAEYRLLFRISRLNSRGSAKKNSALRIGKRKGLSRAGYIALAIIAGLAIFCFEFSIAMQLASAAYKANAVEETLYVLIATTQLVVLFFGVITTTGYLYFSKDKTLLQTLPFEKGVVFAVKSTEAYLSELGINIAVMLPVTLVFGASLDISGYPIPWCYYLFAVLGSFMTPAVPMIVISLISLPVMRVVSLMKKRRVGNGIAMAVLYCIVMVAYFALVGVNASGDGFNLGSDALKAFGSVKKATIFNYPIVNALLGHNAAGNFFIYLAGIVVLFALSLLLALVFYNKSVTASAESAGGVSVRRKRRAEGEVRTPVKSFMLKEFKSLVNTPTLLMNAIISIVMPVLMMAFVRFIFSMDPESVSEDGASSAWIGSGMDMFSIGMVTFMCCIGAVAGGVAGIGFSLEGKNIFALKALPLAPRTIVLIKLAFAMCINVVQTVAVLIAFPLIMQIHNPIAIVGIALISLLMGILSNCMLLYTDLKNPNFNWTNISEITKNNKRVWKPMLLNTGFAMVYMVIGMVLGIVASDMGEWALYGIYFGSAVTILAVASVFAYRKLTERPEYYFNAIGG